MWNVLVNDNKRSRVIPDQGLDGSYSERPPTRIRGSTILSAMLSRDEMTWESFINDVWQKQVHYFAMEVQTRTDIPLSEENEGRWRENFMQSNPWKEMVAQGWNILADLLESAQQSWKQSKDKERMGISTCKEHEIPLIFHNQQVKSVDETELHYGQSLFAAYLDGCSVVLNHADLLNPHIAFLCQDLQKHPDASASSPGFPHVYANCYLTNPGSQTAPPHADDRDVLVFQLVGHKEWQVFSQVPIAYPYTHEQVGKDDLKVPQNVLHGPRAFEGCLGPGDVLYVPRGMVHQAQSSSDNLSFHVTIALATHDWTLGGNWITLIRAKLLECVNHRKSILPVLNDNETTASLLQIEMDAAWEEIRKEITAEIVLKTIKERIDSHNLRVISDRASLIHSARMAAEIDSDIMACMNRQPIDDCVGPLAARKLTRQSWIRASSPIERSHVQQNIKPTGLFVREELADAISQIIGKVKESQGAKKLWRVRDLRELPMVDNPLMCDMTLLCLAKRAVEAGVFAITS